MNTSKLDTLEPQFRATVENLLIELIRVTNLKWEITSARRTIAEQNELYAQGRTKKGAIVTKAKGGQSPHNFGMAVDLCPLKLGKLWWDAPENFWLMMGELAEGIGLVWGGHFQSIKDRPHIEAANWKETQALWKAGKIEIA